MGLSLRGQSSGAIDINAPNAAGNNTITLPGSNGVANQFYKNSATAGTLTHSTLVEDSGGHVSINGSNITDANLLTINGSGATDNVGIVFNKTNAPAKAHGLQVNNATGDLIFFDYTASAERMRVGSAGSVHIGPSLSANGHGLLSLTQTELAAFNALTIQQGNTGFNAGDGLHIGIDAGVNSYIKTFENRAIYFSTGSSNTEKFRIASGGNVGVGTDNPLRHLHVHDDAAVTTAIQLTNGATGATNDNSGFTLKIGSTGQVNLDSRTSNQDIIVFTNGIERMRVGGATGITTFAKDVHITDGNLKVASGKGIDFSATGDGSGTVDAGGEVLDEYEEGTFNPVVTSGFGAATYSTQAGRYTRIGNKVYVDFYLRFGSGNANSDPIQIGGLPFNLSTKTYGNAGAAQLTRGGGGTTFQNLNSSDGNITFYGAAPSNYFSTYIGGTQWATNVADITDLYIIGTFQYHSD